jgi:hypothetical protein
MQRLGAQESVDVVPRLAHVLANRGSLKTCREQAARSLASSGVPEAFPPLFAAAKEADSPVQHVALEALLLLAERLPASPAKSQLLAKMLTLSDEAAVLCALRHLTRSTLAKLVELLTAGDLVVASGAAQLLMGIGGSASRAVSKALKLRSRQARRLACEVLQGIGDANTVLGDEGSGVHGQIRKWEISEQDEQVPAVTSMDQAAIRIQAAEKMRGSLLPGAIPKGWQRWIEGTLHPTIDWRRHLLRRVRGAICTNLGQRVDYTLRRPNRRQHVYHPIIRPSLAGSYQPNVACVIDTSGSMLESDLVACLGEIRGVLDALHAPVTLIPCDRVANQNPARIRSPTPSLPPGWRWNGHGGGHRGSDAPAAVPRRRPRLDRRRDPLSPPDLPDSRPVRNPENDASVLLQSAFDATLAPARCDPDPAARGDKVTG